MSPENAMQDHYDSANAQFVQMQEDAMQIDFIEKHRLSVFWNSHIMEWVIQEQSQVVGCLGHAYLLRHAVSAAMSRMMLPECSICRRRHGNEIQHPCE
jgi:hypothetical protein